MFYIYILKSTQNDSYYIGSCEDIRRRLDSHNRGLTKTTKKFRPWQVVYTEEYETRKTAYQREMKIKSWKKRSAIEKLISNSKFKSRILDGKCGPVA